MSDKVQVKSDRSGRPEKVVKSERVEERVFNIDGKTKKKTYKVIEYQNGVIEKKFISCVKIGG